MSRLTAPTCFDPLPEWLAAPLLGVGACVTALIASAGVLMALYGLLSLVIYLIQEALRRTGELRLVCQAMKRVHGEREQAKRARKEQGNLEL